MRLIPINYIGFIKKLKNLERGFHLTSLTLGPLEVAIEPTPKCNLSCFMCHRNLGPVSSHNRAICNQENVNDVVKEGGYMSKSIFYKALEIGKIANDIRLAGYGEPLLHPNFLEFAWEIKKRKKNVHTITNGTLLNEEACKEMAAMDFDGVCISIDAAKPETLKEIRGTDLNLILNNVRNLSMMRRKFGHDPHKPSIGVNFVAMKKNIAELPDLVEICSRIGVTTIAITDLETHNNPELKKQSLHNYPDLANEYCSLARKNAEEKGIEFNVLLSTQSDPSTSENKNDAIDMKFANNKCHDFFNYAYVTWNGKVLSCCLERFGVGDLNVNTPREIWNGKILKELRRRYYKEGISSVCPDCFRLR